MSFPTLVEALTHLQRNGVSQGAHIYEIYPSFDFHIGTIVDAETKCRFHYMEVRGDNCRIIERSFNFPQKSEWIVRPWKSIDLALLDAQRPHLAA